MMKQRIVYGLLILALGLNLMVGALIYQTTARAAVRDSAYPSLELFSYVLEKVRSDYADGTNLTYQQLVYGALKGMVNTLDPHSEFMEPENYKALQDDTQGAFGGVGLVIEPRDNFVTVVAPIEDTPAFRAEIKSGDRIVKINGRNAERMSVPEAVKILRGEPGTEVSLGILRPSSGQIRDLKLIRAIIKVDMVKDINNKKEFPLGDDKIGYVRIVQFSEKTEDELGAALDKLKAQGLKALVLDLRWNPGGLLDQAVEVCQNFLPRGKLVVTTEGRAPGQSSVRKAMGRGDVLVDKSGEPLPMVILVNLGSASAAEIVAGCLQDWKRAIVLGEKTFGKGSVQSVLPLEGGAALRLTTAKYYTPSHKVIHEHGITPDISVPLTDDEEGFILVKRRLGGIDALEDKVRARARDARDPQLDRATDLLKGLMLYAQLEPAETPAPGRTGKIAVAK
jgi:carboxyl-terminal processing protease